MNEAPATRNPSHENMRSVAGPVLYVWRRINVIGSGAVALISTYLTTDLSIGQASEGRFVETGEGMKFTSGAGSNSGTMLYFRLCLFFVPYSYLGSKLRAGRPEKLAVILFKATLFHSAH